MLEALSRKVDDLNSLSLESRFSRGLVALILALAVFAFS